MPPAEDDAFNGFTPAALQFFETLAQNQTREWFLAHKDIYETAVRAPLGALVREVAFACSVHEIPLTGSAKHSLFRINRDVRFAKDKSPYKTNAGAVLSRDGTKDGRGILYIQVGGARGSMVALGFYGPEPEEQAAIRRAIAGKPAQWQKIKAGLAKSGLALSREDAMVRMPKGFEAEAGSVVAEDIKLRNFIVSRPIANDRLFSPDLTQDVVAFAQAGLPLLEFGWNAIVKRA